MESLVVFEDVKVVVSEQAQNLLNITGVDRGVFLCWACKERGMSLGGGDVMFYLLSKQKEEAGAV
jgi:hypothetical protein